MESITKQEDILEHNFADLGLLPMLSHCSYFQFPAFNIRKQSSIFYHPPIPQRQRSTYIPQYKDQLNMVLPEVKKQQSSTFQKQKTQHNLKSQEQIKDKDQNQNQPTHARYYSKNACKNIVKRCLRSIQLKTYESHLKVICKAKGKKYEDFYCHIMNHLETVSGPSALRILLKNKHVGEIFREYLEWYLSERYVREAIRAGHMSNLKVYIEYKNRELVRILRE